MPRRSIREIGEAVALPGVVAPLVFVGLEVSEKRIAARAAACPGARHLRIHGGSRARCPSGRRAALLHQRFVAGGSRFWPARFAGRVLAGVCGPLFVMMLRYAYPGLKQIRRSWAQAANVATRTSPVTQPMSDRKAAAARFASDDRVALPPTGAQRARERAVRGTQRPLFDPLRSHYCRTWK